MRSLVGIGAFLAMLAGAPPAAAYSCNDAACLSPACHCATSTAPGGLAESSLPQLIVLTIDDGVQPHLYAAISNTLAPYTNPNGCPVPATFFTHAGASDRATVCRAYRDGHEIANHTGGHDTNTMTTRNEWVTQITGAQQFLESALVPASAIRGFRAPLLQLNAELPQVLSFLGYLYDSSVTEDGTNAPVSRGYDRYIWPYTLDNGYGQFCWDFSPGDGACPDVRVRGLWELPLYALKDPTMTQAYSMDPAPRMVGVDERVWVRDLLVHNYGLRKNGNHAPLGIYLHPGWISSYPARVAGLRDFLTMALASGDTWMVTNHSLVQFVQAPQTAAQLTTWAGVSCPVRRVDCESLMGGGGQDASFPDAAPPVDSGVPPDSGLSPDSGGSGDSGHSTDSGVSPPSADAAAATDAAPIYARPIVRTDGCGCRSTPSTAFAEPALLLLLALAATRRKRG